VKVGGNFRLALRASHAAEVAGHGMMKRTGAPSRVTSVPLATRPGARTGRRDDHDQFRSRTSRRTPDEPSGRRRHFLPCSNPRPPTPPPAPPPRSRSPCQQDQRGAMISNAVQTSAQDYCSRQAAVGSKSTVMAVRLREPPPSPKVSAPRTPSRPRGQPGHCAPAGLATVPWQAAHRDIRTEYPLSSSASGLHCPREVVRVTSGTVRCRVTISSRGSLDSPRPQRGRRHSNRRRISSASQPYGAPVLPSTSRTVPHHRALAASRPVLLNRSPATSTALPPR